MGISAIGQDFSNNMFSISNENRNKKPEEALFGSNPAVETGGSVASNGLNIVA